MFRHPLITLTALIALIAHISRTIPGLSRSGLSSLSLLCSHISADAIATVHSSAGLYSLRKNSSFVSGHDF
jgi:hypothetical protein